MTPQFGPRHSLQRAQRGVVLIIALVVLVAMTLAAIALVRSVDTSNLIAGNMAFQQAATHSADLGMETAISWLDANKAALKVGGIPVLEEDDTTNGYIAGGSDLMPDATKNPPQTWDNYWTQSLAANSKALAADSAGNTVSYVIHRMCKNAGSQTGGASCVASPAISSAGGNNEEAGDKQLNAPSSVFYRITVRVAGPRNTVSYVQSMLSL
jgi:Tfp pilus assembly protein PilX